MPNIFISYSRKNTEFGRKLHQAFASQGRDVWMDWEDIPLSSDWWHEISRGIETSDNFLLIMTPDALGSPVCHLEIEHAYQHHKRLIPIFHLDPEKDNSFAMIQARIEADDYLRQMMGSRDALKLAEENWNKISSINWIFCKPDDDFNAKLKEISAILDTDLAHIRQHTRLEVQALEWQSQQANPSFLLNGDEITHNETWLKTADTEKKVPVPTPLQRQYVEESRAFENRRRLLLRRLTMASGILAVLIVLALGAVLVSIDRTQAAVAESELAANSAATAIAAEGEAQNQAATAVAFQVTAEYKADVAATERAIIGATLTPYPPTLTAAAQDIEMARQLANIAETQVSNIGATLTPYPPTLTAAAQDIEVARQLANIAETQMSNIGATLTPYPPTLTAVAEQVEEGQRRLESLRLAAAANDLIDTGNAETVALLAIRAAQGGYSPFLDTVLNKALDRLYTADALQANDASVENALFHPNGEWIVTGSDDGIARFWDGNTGEILREFAGHTNVLWDTTLNADGTWLATASADGTAKVWDSTTGEILFTLEHPAQVNNVLFRSDSQILLTTCNDGLVRLWDLTTGTLAQTFTGHTYWVLAAAFSSDETQIATGDGAGVVIVWDAATGDILYQLHDHLNFITDVMYRPDNSMLLTASRDLSVRIYDPANGEPIGQARLMSAFPQDLAFNPAGDILLISDASGSIAYTNFSTGLSGVLSGHTNLVQQANFSPDGVWIVSASDDGTVRLWSLYSYNVQLKGHTEGIYDSVFWSEDTQLVTISTDKTLRSWDTRTGEQTGQIDLRSGGLVLDFSPDERYLAIGGDAGMLLLLDPENGAILQDFVGHGDAILGVRFSPDGTRLASGGDDGTVRVWDINTGRELFQMTHDAFVNSVNYSPDGRQILSSSYDGTAKIWDATDGSLIATLNHNDLVINAVFSPNGRLIATVSGDNLYLWDATNQTIIRTMTGHTSTIFNAVFSPDGSLLATAAADRTARIWEVATGEMLRVVPGHIADVNHVAFSSDGRFIVTASNDSTARLHFVRFEDVIAYACSRLVRDLTALERQRYGVLDNLPICSS